MARVMSQKTRQAVLVTGNPVDLKTAQLERDLPVTMVAFSR
jgi:hypothetical protein